MVLGKNIDMELHLVDINRELVTAWQEEFVDFSDVHIHEGNILEFAKNTLVSPANGYGFMDGGVDRIYTDFFGVKPQEEIQKKIALRPEGYLPVGTAVFVKTGNEWIPYMISAPTMIGPEAVRLENCFFAMSAMLKEVNHHSSVITEVYCPGLATGIGQVQPKDAAKEMANAYRKWLARKNSIG